VYDISHCKIAAQIWGEACKTGQAYLVRSVPDNGSRCGCYGLCSVAPSLQFSAYSLGAGPLVRARIRQPLLAGAARQICDPGRCQPPRRCFMGDGGRLALQSPVRSHWRDFGRSACLELHGNQTACLAGRGQQNALLADPARRLARSQCCARSVAHCLFTVGTASARPIGPRCSPVASRAVSLAPSTARHMGGKR
jgi:hypothetical protein